jgi:hypothetical protein
MAKAKSPKLTEAQAPVAQQPLQMRQSKDFVSRFATNVQFDLSVWGLRLIFGEFLNENGQPIVDQHTSMHMPWLQAKLLIAYMELNLAGYEAENGTINIPSRFLPVPAPPPEELKANPAAYESALRLAKSIGEIRAKFGVKD